MSANLISPLFFSQRSSLQNHRQILHCRFVRHCRRDIHIPRSAYGAHALGFAEILQREQNHAAAVEHKLRTSIHSSHTVGETVESRLPDRTHILRHDEAIVRFSMFFFRLQNLILQFVAVD